MGLPEADTYDLPVDSNYVNALKPYCDSITYVSRWLNAACIYFPQNNLLAIQNLPFVAGIEMSRYETKICTGTENLSDLHHGQINLLKGQTDRMKASAFKKANLTGKGVTVAIIDAGFTGYTKNSLLRSVRANNQIKHTWDFVRKSPNVDHGSTHGTAVLSCIAGKIDSVYMGCAYDADILLYRTEKGFNEKFSEEEYWMAAVEMADKHGAQIINTSLGYNERRYFQKDMDGKKSLLSRAANIASRKGILVVCSAGNEGDIDWKIICTPADADSALTVGAINPWTGIQASWSSFGPSADKRMKPNVAAYGYVMAADAGDGIYETLGTSFSSPLVAGFAACVRQLNPGITAYALLKKIELSADLYPYYDYAHGYGVPQADFILNDTNKRVYDTAIFTKPTFEIVFDKDSILQVILSTDAYVPAFIPVRGYYTLPADSMNQYTSYEGNDYKSSVHFYDEWLASTEISSLFTTEPGYFYYNITLDGEDYLDEYCVINVRQKEILRLRKSFPQKTYTFHYRGYTKTIQF
ncbi:MAG TPA: S8 family serine peptidase [Flavobacteriales bacterium]|nr:S8 family serine peptidase [Flavobacteriales bacterium]